MNKIAEILAKRNAAVVKAKEIAAKDAFDEAVDGPVYKALVQEISGCDASIARIKEANALEVKDAQPAAGQATPATVAAAAVTDRYVKEPSLVVGGLVKMLAKGGGNYYNAKQAAIDTYGENHPITKALATNVGTAGGFIIPPDYMAEIIPLLRARAIVRQSGPRNMPMPRGTMTIPGQSGAASASYGAENAKITASQQTLNSIVASYKKLTALVPVSNDMMRYSDPAVDAFVRDDLVKVIALREDLAFILGDGLADSPRGFLSFANGWVIFNKGTAGVWSTTNNSTFAVNAADPANSTGGNFILSTAAFTAATVANELAGAINRLDTANVPASKRTWLMSPRSKNYLYNVQNALGLYIWRDEMSRGLLLGIPFQVTTQIGNNYWDATGTNKDLSFVFLCEMDEAIILDSMQMELAVSREGSYVDTNSNTISAFQNDQTIIRAIEEHDFQLRHDASVAVIQGVRWAPAIS